MLPILAGIISTLISNNLPKVAQAVADKGLDYVEEKLGVKLEPEMSAEKIAEIQSLALKHEEFLISEENNNTKNARESNVRIQESSEASWLSKNSAYIIDFIIVLSTVIVSFCAFFIGIPVDNKEVVYTLLGSLFTLTGTILNFHRGTSSGSQRKDTIIDRIIK
jgi:hypothetical protein